MECPSCPLRLALAILCIQMPNVLKDLQNMKKIVQRTRLWKNSTKVIKTFENSSKGLDYGKIVSMNQIMTKYSQNTRLRKKVT